MKRRELLRKISGAANQAGLQWLLEREGASHQLWLLDDVRVTVPRHREINDRTAQSILTSLEPKLGKDWWRR